MKNILEDNGIEYKAESKYNTTCPQCEANRTKRHKANQKCLSVFGEEECVVWQCNNSSCEWAKRQVHYFKKGQMKTTIKVPEEKFKPWNDKGVWTGDLKELFDKSIKYPYYNRDEQLMFYILRTGDKDEKQIRPISLGLDNKYVLSRPSGINMPYRIESFDPSKPTLIVEGEKAADYAAKIAKKSNVLSWVGGSNNVSKTDWSILKGTEVTLWADADEAGLKAMEELQTILIETATPSKLYKINVSELPKGFDIADIADMELIKSLFLGKEEVELDQPLDGELNPMDLQALHSRQYKYYPTGFSNVDRFVQFPNSGLVVISGRTNHGKTAMMINMALNLAQNTDLTVMYLSYEFPISELNIRMVKTLDGTMHTESGWEEDLFIDQAIRDMSLPACHKYAELLASRKLRVVDSQTTIDQVLSAMNRLAALGKPVAVFIDYLQVIPLPSNTSQRYLQLKEMVEKIRLVANKNNQLLIGGSQLTSGQTGYQDSVRESKDIEFTAALHFKVWNKLKAAEKKDTSYDDVGGDIVLIVEKARQSNANGKKFGFVSPNGCCLQPYTVDLSTQEY